MQNALSRALDNINLIFFIDRCCCCKPCCKGSDPEYVRDDNCCECNLVALKKLSGLTETDLVYVTYHVDVSIFVCMAFYIFVSPA